MALNMSGTGHSPLSAVECPIYVIILDSGLGRGCAFSMQTFQLCRQDVLY